MCIRDSLHLWRGLGIGLHESRFALGNRLDRRIGIDGHRNRRRLDLGAFGLFALIAQTAHQIAELLQRHAGDRQHVRRGFKPRAAVFGAQDVGQPFEHVDADGARTRRVITRQRVMPVSYTHLDVYKRQHLNEAYVERAKRLDRDLETALIDVLYEVRPMAADDTPLETMAKMAIDGPDK